jgi:hypothetical protein
MFSIERVLTVLMQCGDTGKNPPKEALYNLGVLNELGMGARPNFHSASRSLLSMYFFSFFFINLFIYTHTHTSEADLNSASRYLYLSCHFHTPHSHAQAKPDSHSLSRHL